MYHQVIRWYTSVVPTSLPRHQVTETPTVAHALDLAGKRWPGESRSRLLVLLLEMAAEKLTADRHQAAERHRVAVEASSGRYPKAFGPGFLEGLREDWSA